MADVMTERNPITDNLMLYFLGGLGGQIAGPGSAGGVLGNMVQQNVRAQSQARTQGKYSQFLRDLLAAGGKLNMDKDNFSIKAPASAIKGTGALNIEEFDPLSRSPEGQMATQSTPAGTSPSNYVINPSSSSPGITASDLAGLTPDEVSRALSGAIGVSDLQRRSVRDLVDSIYKGALIERTEAMTQQLIPSITIPGTDIKLTERGFVNWFRTASRDTRATRVKEYEFAVENGYEGSFEDWAKTMSKAAGMGLAEYLNRAYEGTRVREAAKQETGVLGPGYHRDIEKRLAADPGTWFYPPGYSRLREKYEGAEESEILELARREMVLTQMEKDLEELPKFKGKKVEFKGDGWYVDGKLVKRNPYYD